MEFILNENDMQSSITYFDSVVAAIQKKQFEVKQPPDIKMCLECDFKKYCFSQGIIKLKQTM